MSCVKGKRKAKPKRGRYECAKCGGVSKKKGDLCKPSKIHQSAGKKKKKGKN